MKNITLIFCLTTYACQPIPNNSEIIAQYKACKDAGVLSYQDIDGHVHCYVPNVTP